MNRYLKQLIELSTYDKQIDEFTPQIEEIEKKVGSKEDEIGAVSKQEEELLDDNKELASQISKTNIQIQEFAQKLKEVSKKKNTIKTEKELKALSTEETVAKEQLNAANEEIARLERVIESKKEQHQELEEKKKALEDELEEMKKKSDEELAKIEKERNAISKNKAQLLKEMDQKIISFYEKIRKWAKNSAVVPVKKQACYGCFLRINEKTYYSVLKGDEIVTCPHCGRILYKEESSTKEKSE